MVSLVFATDRSAIQTILRLALGLVMLPHGLQKTVGWLGGYGFGATLDGFQSIGIPVVLGFLAIAAESAGALALLAGLTTRIAAFGIGVTMTVAAFMHRVNGIFMNWSGTQAGEGFEFHILAIAIALALIIGGGGRFSADRALAARLG
ncbi:MAG: DoxX family protein [Thermoanaerobaculia bacterium]